MRRTRHDIPAYRDLPDDVVVDLVRLMFTSRVNIRWLSAIMLTSTIYGALESDSGWTLVTAIAVWVISLLRIAIAESYVRYGHACASKQMQLRWKALYLLGGTALALAFSAFLADAILRGDAWLTASSIAIAVGGAYGAIPYVGLCRRYGFGQTLPYVFVPAIALMASNEDIRWWMAVSLFGAVLSVKGQSDRTYVQTVTGLLDRRTVERLASTDELTGLWNRRQLELVTSQAITEGLPNVHWLGVDLDRFKAVNDELGHEAGDRVLKDAAGRIASVVGPDAFVSRMGGDEFVVLMIGDRAAASAVADAIRVRLADPIRVSGGIARIGASVGATAICAHDTIDEIARRADERMYAQKATTRLAA